MARDEFGRASSSKMLMSFWTPRPRLAYQRFRQLRLGGHLRRLKRRLIGRLLPQKPPKLRMLFVEKLGVNPASQRLIA